MTHGLNYLLFYGLAGERVVVHDNERGKGDHRHVMGRGSRDRFVSVEQLVSGFLADVAKAREGEGE